MQYDCQALGPNCGVRAALRSPRRRLRAHAGRRLRSDIARHADAYDAFVVLHGTDTMAFTASALSFMLENLSKTVVVTGAATPGLALVLPPT